MCQVAPGPRCANHTRARRTSISRKVRKLAADISAIEEAQEQATRDGEKFPKSKLREAEKLRARKQTALNELRVAVREYDGTKTGQAELKAKIESAKTDKERKRLQNRLTEGRMLYDWRKNALQLKRENPDYKFSDVSLANAS